MGVEGAAELDDSNRLAAELEQAHDVSFDVAVVEDDLLPTHERGRPLLPPEERSHRLASMLAKGCQAPSLLRSWREISKVKVAIVPTTRPS